MSEPKRFCAFCDKEVQTATKGKTIIGQDTNDGDFIHIPANGTCGRNLLTESQTYTEGVSDSDSSNE